MLKRSFNYQYYEYSGLFTIIVINNFSTNGTMFYLKMQHATEDTL